MIERVVGSVKIHGSPLRPAGALPCIALKCQPCEIVVVGWHGLHVATGEYGRSVSAGVIASPRSSLMLMRCTKGARESALRLFSPAICARAFESNRTSNEIKSVAARWVADGLIMAVRRCY